MIKKSIIAIIVIAILAAGVLIFANSGNHVNPVNNSNFINNQEEQQNLTANSTPTTVTSNKSTVNTESTATKSKSNNVKSQVKISAAEAKRIAQNSNKMPGEIAGTPKLTKEHGTYMYIVPFFKNGKNVGCIGVDAQTGDTSKI